MAKEPRIPLSAVLGQLAKEIRTAHENAKVNGAVMQFEEIELEFGFEIEAEGEAGAKFWIFNLGGKVKKSDTNTFKIKYRALPGFVAPILAENVIPEHLEKLIDRTATDDQ